MEEITIFMTHFFLKNNNEGIFFFLLSICFDSRLFSPSNKDAMLFCFPLHHIYSHNIYICLHQIPAIWSISSYQIDCKNLFVLSAYVLFAKLGFFLSNIRVIEIGKYLIVDLVSNLHFFCLIFPISVQFNEAFIF